MTTFKVSEKTKLDFEFIVSGEKIVETVYIDLDNPALRNRLVESEARLREKAAEIDVEKVETGEPVDVSGLKTMKDVESLTAEQLEYVYAAAEAQKKMLFQLEEAYIDELCEIFSADLRPLFKHCRPFDAVGENYYVYSLIEALGNEIIERQNKLNKKIEKNMAKKPYMQKYMKSKR